ncbi:MAG: serine/threonine protein kinase [Pirellulales bacterium]|nr:serine/threonine protein kinase [Pirellulales bacterium]
MKLLGKGGMGAVYQVYDKNRRGPVALKVPFFKTTEDEVGSKYFLDEAQKHSGLEMFPNVCPVYDVDSWDNRCYFTMTLIDGQTLSDAIIQRAPFEDLKEAVHVTATLARALQRIHNAGVLHRDIKPGNVMMSRDHGPILMDFGIARDSSILSSPDDKFGTLPYMAPERIAHDICDQRSDVYSLGLVLYELLTGQRAFVGDEKQLQQNIVEGAPANVMMLNPDVGYELSNICHTSIAKDRDQRYGSAEKFAEALEKWEPPPPPLPPPKIPMWLKWTVGAVFAGLVGYFLWGPLLSPSGILDRNGRATGFTHRIPGTGLPLEEPDPNLDLSANSNYLTVSSTKADLVTSTNLGELQNVAIRLPGNLAKTKDIALSVKVHDANIGKAGSNQLSLFAANSKSKCVLGGLHYGTGGQGYSLTRVPGPPFKGLTGSRPNRDDFLDGDNVTLTLSRQDMKWRLSWKNSSPERCVNLDGAIPGECNESTDSFAVPFLDQGDLYLGFLFATPQSNGSESCQIDEFELKVDGEVFAAETWDD